MTIIAAYEGEESYWIGSDSYAIGGGILVERGSKLINKKNYTVGFSASYRVADIIREDPDKLLSTDIKSIKNLAYFRDMIKDMIIQDGVYSGSDDTAYFLSDNPVSLLMISRYGIWSIEEDYQIHKIEEGYAAIGAGEQIALGSLYTSKEYNDKPGEIIIKLAIEAAIKHCDSCGGNVHIRELRKIK